VNILIGIFTLPDYSSLSRRDIPKGIFRGLDYSNLAGILTPHPPHFRSRRAILRLADASQHETFKNLA
jgi:hypothetical protein